MDNWLHASSIHNHEINQGQKNLVTFLFGLSIFFFLHLRNLSVHLWHLHGVFDHWPCWPTTFRGPLIEFEM